MKIALGIEYNGKQYCGWQRQEKVRSVQEELEKALSFVANEKIEVFCAGRTDSGVHGTGQVVHFETTAVRPEKAWAFGTNANLPDDISVSWAKVVDDEFHARFSATARRYRYILYCNKLRSAILPEGITHCHLDLDEKKMHQAGQFLLGENDFSFLVYFIGQKLSGSCGIERSLSCLSVFMPFFLYLPFPSLSIFLCILFPGLP